MHKEEIEAYCPNCKMHKWSWIEAQHENREVLDEYEMWWEYKHRILKCKTCKSTFYQREETNSDDLDLRCDADGNTQGEFTKHFDYFPLKSQWTRPLWSDDVVKQDSDLANIFNELYSAFDNDLHILAAIGIRTAFDRITGKIGIDPASTFGEKLTKLVEEKRLTAEERSNLEILVDAGGAAAHRGWEPSVSELERLLKYLELFTYKVLFPAPSLASLRDIIPPKPRKAKKPFKH